MGILDKIIMRRRGIPTGLSLDDAAALLKTTPDALSSFEKAYQRYAIDVDENEDDPFHVNSRMAAKRNWGADSGIDRDLQHRIVNELLADTKVYAFDGDLSVAGSAKTLTFPAASSQRVVLEDISKLPPEFRPQLSGDLMDKDIGQDSYPILLEYYKIFLDERNPKKKQLAYNLFRQGLDILDLDPITYEILNMNRNSMGNWLPALVEACRGTDFFHIPATRIATVPLPLLQLTHIQYETLTRATKDIVNEWAMKAFGLDVEREYFVKTGTYSSKFDFRNAYVHDPQEVRELGEYLLYIHYQALTYAGYNNSMSVSMYGMSTTREWCVRDFIRNKENCPSIYKGLPLHTEYRVFADCDTCKVLGLANYWEPSVMKACFESGAANHSIHDAHDYVIYKSYEDTLTDRFEQNKQLVADKVKAILPRLDLKGQWSIDVMQNGNEFWIIDMAVAENSFYYQEVVAPEDRRPLPENWLPKLGA